MSVNTHNFALIDEARRCVDKIATALAAADIEARFDISYEGFGSGGTTGVSAAGAHRYLNDMTSVQDVHARYRTRIRNITVTATVCRGFRF